MNFNYHIHKSNIKCPYCDEDCQEDDYEVSQTLEEEVEFQCEHCDKMFYAKAEIVFSTHASCTLNNKEHVLKETHIKGFYECKNCSHYEQKELKDGRKNEN